MIRSLSFVLLAASLLNGTIPAIQAQVIVEAPKEGSGLKWFEFAGGTPARLMEELKKTFGPFGIATTMEDATAGNPLPAAKMFAANAQSFLEKAYHPKWMERTAEHNLLNYKFKSEKGPDPFAAGPPADPFASTTPGSTPAPPAPVLCQFPGGTPRELVKFLDRTFSCRMEEVTTIAPEMENVRLPALNLRVPDAAAFIEKLNGFSADCAGTCGYWELAGRDGEPAKAGAELEALLISPMYDDRNPPPAILARDTAAGPAATAVRALEARIKTTDAALQQTRQALEALQKQVKELPAKAP